jgi:hypothetical protein
LWAFALFYILLTFSVSVKNLFASILIMSHSSPMFCQSVKDNLWLSYVYFCTLCLPFKLIAFFARTFCIVRAERTRHVLQPTPFGGTNCFAVLMFDLCVPSRTRRLQQLFNASRKGTHESPILTRRPLPRYVSWRYEW